MTRFPPLYSFCACWRVLYTKEVAPRRCQSLANTTRATFHNIVNIYIFYDFFIKADGSKGSAHTGEKKRIPQLEADCIYVVRAQVREIELRREGNGGRAKEKRKKMRTSSILAQPAAFARVSSCVCAPNIFRAPTITTALLFRPGESDEKGRSRGRNHSETMNFTFEAVRLQV